MIGLGIGPIPAGRGWERDFPALGRRDRFTWPIHPPLFTLSFESFVAFLHKSPVSGDA